MPKVSGRGAVAQDESSSSSAPSSAGGGSGAEESVAALQTQYADAIQQIQTRGAAELSTIVGLDPDLLVLRLAVARRGDVAGALESLRHISKWRLTEGKAIVDAAAEAIAKATASSEKRWDNAPVRAAAPYSQAITKFLGPSQMLVVTLPDGHLCTCIKPSAIQDSAMMDEVEAEHFRDFLMYTREVMSQVADQRSRTSGRLIKLSAVNDLSGVRRLPDSRFYGVLKQSAIEAHELYPGYAGRSAILNAPGLLRFLATFLLPIFTTPDQKDLLFLTRPMPYLTDLSDVTQEHIKSRFVQDLYAALTEA